VAGPRDKWFSWTLLVSPQSVRYTAARERQYNNRNRLSRRRSEVRRHSRALAAAANSHRTAAQALAAASATAAAFTCHVDLLEKCFSFF
jgi:hypothetical protein